MSSTASCGARSRTPSAVVAAVLVVSAAVGGALVYQSAAVPSSSTTALPSGTAAHRPHTPLPRDRAASVGLADGVVPDGTTVFDDVPAVAQLDPDLRGALRRAAADAVGDGVVLYLNSGWRSAAYQEQLLDEAVAKYGSRAEAARWVATPETSPHVLGDAVDIGHADAAAWLSRHGGGYGLCQVYGNEPWHYELRPSAIGHGCPPEYADAAHDPRMRP